MIVILALIAVIATPIITNIIEDSKKSAFNRSVEEECVILIPEICFEVEETVSSFEKGDNCENYFVNKGLHKK